MANVFIYGGLGVMLLGSVLGFILVGIGITLGLN